MRFDNCSLIPRSWVALLLITMLSLTSCGKRTLIVPSNDRGTGGFVTKPQTALCTITDAAGKSFAKQVAIPAGTKVLVNPPRGSKDDVVLAEATSLECSFQDSAGKEFIAPTLLPAGTVIGMSAVAISPPAQKK